MFFISFGNEMKKKELEREVETLAVLLIAAYCWLWKVPTLLGTFQFDIERVSMEGLSKAIQPSKKHFWWSQLEDWMCEVDHWGRFTSKQNLPQKPWFPGFQGQVQEGRPSEQTQNTLKGFHITSWERLVSHTTYQIIFSYISYSVFCHLASKRQQHTLQHLRRNYWLGRKILGYYFSPYRLGP